MVVVEGVAKPAAGKNGNCLTPIPLREGTEQMDRDYLLSYCRLELHDIYTVVTVNEGVHIDFTETGEIGTVLQSHYHDKPFGLIANRVNRYSTNPLALKQFFSNEQVVAGAIVGSHRTTRLNAEIEIGVIDGAPVAFFTRLEDARNWMKATVKEQISAINMAPV